MKNKSALIIMAKEPKVGATKTRLCPPLTHEDAARLYEALLRDTIDSMGRLDHIDLAIAITPPESKPFFERISPPRTLLLPVTCLDIGDCLNRVLNQLLELGYQKAIALNADGPTVPLSFVEKGFEHLEKHDLVFGPSEDGGYYMVGLTSNHPEIFEGVAWSTPKVMGQTIAIAKETNLRYTLTPSWYDVDTEADIERLRGDMAFLPADRLIHCRRFFQET